MISIENLKFSFPTHPLFDQLNIEIAGNQWIGILGLNGSGKSTLLKLILGILVPDQGQIKINGESPASAPSKQLVGASLQEIDFPANIRVQEVLQFVTAHYHNPVPIRELEQKFFLSDFTNKKCGELSGGMRRRLSLACAFAGRPKVVLLDEPTTGLDHGSRLQLLANIAEYKMQNNSLVLMISHHPQEISQHVDRFLIFRPQLPPHWLAPEKVAQLTQLRKITFTSPQDLTFSDLASFNHDIHNYEIVCADSDRVVRELTIQTDNFANLAISQVPLEEILEDFL